MQVELAAENMEAIREISTALHQSPEETAAEALARGLHTLKRQIVYSQKIGTVTAEEGLAALRRMGLGTLPDPGDELPEGCERILQASIAPE